MLAGGIVMLAALFAGGVIYPLNLMPEAVQKLSILSVARHMFAGIVPEAEKERKRRSKHRCKKAVSARHCANFLQCKPKYHHAPPFAEPCRRAALPPKAAAAAPHSRAKIPAAAASGPKPQPPPAASGTMPANICRATDKMLSF